MTDQNEASPSTQLRLQVGGQLNPRKHLYIVRTDLEDQVFELLRQAEYCNILSSRQVGKSSLMNSVGLRLQAAGVRVVAIDVAGNLGMPPTPVEWYQGLVGRIAQQLRLDLDVKAWWDQAGGITANEKLTEFFGIELFRRTDAPVVIFLDEIDSTLKLKYTDDFFTAIRAMYNQRATVANNEKVTFCLVGVATPNELVKQRRTTAYNVGRTIALRDFDRDRDDLSPLVQALSAGGRDGEALLDAILRWSGGHPLLTLQLCQDVLQGAIDSPEAIDRFVEDRFASYGKVSAQEHFQWITSFLDQRLTDQGRTLKLYQQILAGRKIADGPSRQIIELKLAGLIRRDDQGQLVVRNRIYEKIFDAGWVRSTKPQRTVRHLAWTSGIAATLVLALGIWLGYDYFHLEPERRRVAVLIKEIDQTSDPEQAERFAGYLRGERLDPRLGRTIRSRPVAANAALVRFWKRREQAISQAIGTEFLITLKTTLDMETARQARDILTGKINAPYVGRPVQGFEDQGRAAYQEFERRRGEWVADKYLAALKETADKTRAEELFQLLTGQRESIDLGRSLQGFGAEAVEGYRAFWERQADKLEKSAQARLEDKRLDQALILASAAALKAHRPVSAGFREAFVARGYSRLHRTMRSERSYRDLCEVAISPQGNLVADGRGSVWMIATGQLVRKLPWKSGIGIGVDFSPDQHLLAISNNDGRVNVWKTTDWTQEKELTLGSGSVSIYEVKFSRDSKSLAAISRNRDQQLWVWDTQSWKLETPLSDIGSWPVGLAFFPNGDKVAIASRRGIEIWNLRTAKEILSFPPDARGVAITEDGNKLVSAGVSGVVTIRDLEKDKSTSIPPHDFDRNLWAVDWSPDSRFIIVSYTGGAEIWNVRSKSSVFVINAHGDEQVNDARFSADGRFAVTLGEDNTIRVWNTADLESEPPGFPQGNPEEVWQHMQQVLNLTLDENDEVVPLWPGDLRKLDGWDPLLSERLATDRLGDAVVRK